MQDSDTKRPEHADTPGALALPARDIKPRRKGITSVIDWGPDTFGWGGSEIGIRSALECASDYIDFVKIFAPNLLLIPEQTIKKAITCYRDCGVSVYAGGIIFEYAYRRNELDSFLHLLRRVGLDALEVSENCVSLSRGERMKVIDQLQKQGFQVVYEYGAKDPDVPMQLGDLDQIVADLLTLGIEYVTLEQSELDLLASERPADMEQLKARDWFSRALIEADPYRFPKQHATMLAEFGSDVNLANITLGQALRLEGMRRGIGRAVGYSIFSDI
jgi:phosphosulfolactate synthase